jgi:hypothetical protein
MFYEIAGKTVQPGVDETGSCEVGIGIHREKMSSVAMR